MAQLTATQKPIDRPFTLDDSRCLLKVWIRRHKTRKDLKELWINDPDRLLVDLGLHPFAVEKECRKWFWQA